jgi:signal transduction histidine kinase/PAS domain-containing protein/ActR/RegA family two-component response regulator
MFLTAITFLVHWMLLIYITEQPLFILFIVPILLSAYLGGLGPGLFSTAIVAFGGVWAQCLSEHPSRILWSLDVLLWLMVLTVGIVVTVLIEAARRSAQRAWQAERQREGLLAQQRVAESESQLRMNKLALREALWERQLALEAADQGTWKHDLQSGDLVGDERTAAMFGRPNQFRAIHFEEFLAAIHPDDREQVRQRVQRALAPQSEGQFEAEYRTVWPDGSIHWLLAKGKAYFDGDERDRRAARIVGTLMDITRRRLDEEKLRLNEMRLQTLVRLNEMTAASVQDITDFALEAAVSLTRSKIGYLAFVDETETVLTMHSWSKMAMEQCALENKPLVYPLASTGLWGEAVRQRKPIINNDYQAPHPWKKGQPEGHIPLFRHMSAPIFDGNRIVIAAGVGNKDDSYNDSDVRQVTLLMHGMWQLIQRKRAAEEMAAAHAAADAANRAKSQFLANMSHEIRTPMNAILGMTDLALSEDLPPTVRDYLQTTKDSADLLLDLLNQVLDLSRIEAGRFELESTPFSLRRTVEQVVKSFDVRAVQKDLGLLHEVSADVPDRLIGDPLRLQQVLMNLVGNAVKFTHHGQIMMRVSVESASHDEVQLKLAVSDTGIGISPEDQRRIFSPFTQADASTTRHYGGSGLGLAISQSLVALMGGSMGVESQPGKGSTFFFSVRLKPETEVGETKEAGSGQAESTIADSQTAFAIASPEVATRPLRVLLAEDTPANQKLVVHILTKRGHAVEIAADGQETLDLLQQREFDAVLMDVQMPVMDGFQATAAIRSWNSSKSHIPIIAMTAHALKGDETRCLDGGMDAYISKPIDSRKLVMLVERMASPSVT